MRSRAGLCLGAAALLAAALLEPVLARRGLHLEAALLRSFFRGVCHQLPLRSFAVAGLPMAICARCAGIYAGASAGAWVRSRRGNAVRLLATAAAINGCEWLAARVWPALDLGWVRAACGLGLGFAAAALLAGGGPYRRAAAPRAVYVAR